MHGGQILQGLHSQKIIMRLLVAAVLSILVVKWVGDVTVYAPDGLERRSEFHQSILDNQPIEGKTWMDMGAEGLNVRLLTVWIAEHLHANLDLQIEFVYRIIDVTSVFGMLLIAHVYFRHWYDEGGAFAGMVLLGALLPMTMFQHLFHPWDKPSMLLWVVMALTVCKGSLLMFTLTYILAVAVKFDALSAVGIVWFAGVSRLTIVRTSILTAFLLTTGLILFAALLIYFPGGVGPRGIVDQWQRNLAVMRELGLAYPPLLIHGLMFCAGLFAWKNGDVLARRLWLCGIVLLIPHLLFTNFAEVRAQMGTVICMLPLALAACGCRWERHHDIQHFEFGAVWHMRRNTLRSQ